jgi:prepilin peptidase CpaA
VLGILFNAAGVMGAGDAKFIAAAAPYIALGDLRFLAALFTATVLAAFVTHRLAKHTPLRRLAPEWESWTRHRDFPMGLALGGTLSLYLLLGIAFGG